jgi:FMN reductase
MTSRAPYIVIFGGTTRPNSSTEQVLHVCETSARSRGAVTRFFSAADLQLPLYAPETALSDTRARELVEALRRADGVIVGSPGYHGGISGLVKNVLDYAEELSSDSRPYLDGRAVGCVACAYGWQAAVTTLSALRAVAHALRGWPTPYGLAINSATTRWDSPEHPDPGIVQGIDVMVGQVIDFATTAIRASQAPAAPLNEEVLKT